MDRFTLGDVVTADVTGTSLGPAGINREDVRRSILGVLEATPLCSMATVSPEGTAHITIAYFSYSDALEIFFLSHPASPPPTYKPRRKVWDAWADQARRR